MNLNELSYDAFGEVSKFLPAKDKLKMREVTHEVKAGIEGGGKSTSNERGS